MTEKQRDIHERVYDYYSNLHIEKEEIEQKVVSILREISQKVYFEEKQIKQKVNDLLSNIVVK